MTKRTKYEHITEPFTHSGNYKAVPMKWHKRYYKILSPEGKIVARFVDPYLFFRCEGRHPEKRDYATPPHRIDILKREMADKFDEIISRHFPLPHSLG